MTFHAPMTQRPRMPRMSAQRIAFDARSVMLIAAMALGGGPRTAAQTAPAPALLHPQPQAQARPHHRARVPEPAIHRRQCRV